MDRHTSIFTVYQLGLSNLYSWLAALYMHRNCEAEEKWDEEEFLTR